MNWESVVIIALTVLFLSAIDDNKRLKCQIEELRKIIMGGRDE